MKWWWSFVNIGSDKVSDGDEIAIESKKVYIRLFNALCLRVASVFLSMVVCASYLKAPFLIIIIGLVGLLVLVVNILLNHLGYYIYAMFSFIAFINCILLGQHLLITGLESTFYLELIGIVLITLLLSQDSRHRWICYFITVFTWILGEYLLYLSSIQVPVIVEIKGFPTSLCAYGGIILDLYLIGSYIGHQQSVRNLEKAIVNKALEEVRNNNMVLEQKTSDCVTATGYKSILVREVIGKEMRMALNAIYGISQSLLLKVKANSSLESISFLVKNLYTSSYFIKGVLENISDDSKMENSIIDKAEPSPLNIREWIDSVVNVIYDVAAVKDIRVEIDVAKDLPKYLLTDRILLTKMLNNLLSNAIKSAPDGSLVTACLIREFNQLAIFVSDQGKGISEESLENIFDPFISKKPPFFDGIALGLYITRRWAELMGGKVEVKSRSGVGSTFTLRLPLVPTSFLLSKDTIAEVQEMNKFEGTKVLIIDNDRISRMWLSEFLSLMGCDVIEADDSEGLLFIELSPPDLIIIDTFFTEGSGMGLILKIRQGKSRQGIPIIATSRSFFETEDVNLLIREAVLFLDKPLKPRDLHNAMVRLLNYGGWSN